MVVFYTTSIFVGTGYDLPSQDDFFIASSKTGVRFKTAPGLRLPRKNEINLLRKKALHLRHWHHWVRATSAIRGA